MYGIRYPRHLHRLRACFLALLAGLSLSAIGQTYKPTTGLGYSADATKFWMDLNANRVNIGMSPVAVYPLNVDSSKITFPTGAIQAGAAAVGSTSTGDTAMVSRVATKLANKDIVIDVEAKVIKSTLGGALARFAAKTLPGINTAYAIGELFKELNIGISPGATGADNRFTEETLQVRYRVDASSPWATTPVAACQVGIYWVDPASWTIVNRGSEELPILWCYSNGSAYTGLQRDVGGGSTQELTEQDVADRIAAKSGWPSNSMIKQALADALKAGNQVATEPLTVKGPSSVPPSTDVEKSTKLEPSPTQSNPNAQKTIETTKTTTTENPITYTTDKATVTPKVTVTTTTKTTNPDGSVTTSTGTETSETTKDPSTPDEQTDFCKIHPEVLACKEIDVPEETMPKITKEVTYAPEAIGWAAASCPPPIQAGSVMGIAVNLTFDPFCDVAIRIKPFIVAGAAFVAMLIVMGGIKA